MPSCRSSGLLTANTQVFTGKCKLISIHVNNDSGGVPCQIKVFDGTDNTGKELARINIDGAGVQNLEFDMHGVICSVGLFYEETSGNANTFIHFA
tara:strand:- start:204 stop:488 length:285 start_codon:yes stop_codon:yes gene_type:complete